MAVKVLGRVGLSMFCISIDVAKKKNLHTLAKNTIFAKPYFED
jgi:hypothetical protein